jgi:hypothetical protein
LTEVNGGLFAAFHDEQNVDDPALVEGRLK